MDALDLNRTERNGGTFFKIILIIFIIALFVYFGFYYGAKIGATKAVQAMRAQAVTPYVRVGAPITREIQDSNRFIALVKPLNAVDVKTQVSGTVQEVSFTDGQFVHAGDVLFTIEQDRYKANVSSAKATLTKAEADLKQMRSDYKRQERLHKDKVISTADLEKAESRMAQAAAAVEQAKAALELAEIDLAHTTIEAPIDGRIGQVLITKGNYVDLATPALARIVQTTPVKITFALSDKEHLAIRKMLRANGIKKEKPNLKIELSDKSILPLETNRIFIDNEMDRATATISLFAEYENSDELLVPNNHVTVLWQTNEQKPVLLIPQTAICNDTNGSYVMRVNPDNTVVQQYIKSGQSFDEMIEIESGLKLEDTIVFSGAQKLKSGQAIHVIPTEAK